MLENEMDFENRIIAPEYTSMEDSDVETSLRPKTLSEYIGQEKACGRSRRKSSGFSQIKGIKC